MRIIAGIHKGKTLFSPQTSTIRPTSDRAREAIFNIVTHFLGAQNLSLEELVVLDAFAGTGALGLEALSRGAQRAIFIDQNKEAASLILSNISHLREEERALFLRRDATRPSHPLAPADLIFLDPPYYKNLVPSAVTALIDAGWAKKNSLWIIEISQKETVPALPQLKLLDQRLYGQAKILIFLSSF